MVVCTMVGHRTYATDSSLSTLSRNMLPLPAFPALGKTMTEEVRLRLDIALCPDRVELRRPPFEFATFSFIHEGKDDTNVVASSRWEDDLELGMSVRREKRILHSYITMYFLP